MRHAILIPALGLLAACASMDAPADETAQPAPVLSEINRNALPEDYLKDEERVRENDARPAVETAVRDLFGGD